MDGTNCNIHKNHTISFQLSKIDKIEAMTTVGNDSIRLNKTSSRARPANTEARFFKASAKTIAARDRPALAIGILSWAL
jgi:hypothetical protein